METYGFNQDQKLVQAQKKVKCIKGFYIHAMVYVFVNAFIIAGCAVDDLNNLKTSEPYMTALFWGIGLAAHGMSVFGQNFLFGTNWEQKEIQKFLNK